MTDIRTIDARGLSCPQPAMLTRQVLQKLDKGTIEVLVDTSTALENISRLAGHSGWEVTVEEQSENNYRVVLKK